MTNIAPPSVPRARIVRIIFTCGRRFPETLWIPILSRIFNVILVERNVLLSCRAVTVFVWTHEEQNNSSTLALTDFPKNYFLNGKFNRRGFSFTYVFRIRVRRQNFFIHTITSPKWSVKGLVKHGIKTFTVPKKLETRSNLCTLWIFNRC
jgi:hypothetical protein